MTFTLLALVIFSSFLNAAWNLVVRDVKWNLSAIWLALTMASLISTPFAFKLPYRFVSL